jgi:outer membrane lipoprotein-sorting protein
MQAQLGMALETVRVHVHAGDGLLRRVAYLDEAGEEVMHQAYRDVVVNPKLPEETFEFVIPSGAHVMDMTEQIIELLESVKSEGG